MYGPWQTAWTWRQRLADDSIWDRIHAEPSAVAEVAGLIDWSLPADSTIVCGHQHVRNITRRTGGVSNNKNPGNEPPEYAVVRSRGGQSTKIHPLLDGHGRPLVALLTPGQAGDSPMLIPLMDQLHAERAAGRPRNRTHAMRGDRADSLRGIRAYLRSCGIKAVIPEPDDQKGHRFWRGSRGGRPVNLDAADYKNRNVFERHYCHLKQ